MYQDNINGISMKLVLDKRSKNQKGLYPVRVQVIFRRNTKYYNTGKNLTEEDWNKLAVTRSPQLMDIKSCIKESFDLIVKNVRELSAKGEFTFDALNIFLGRESGGNLIAALTTRMKELKESDQIRTMLTFKDTINSLKKYTSNEIPFTSVTVDWLNKYEKHLLEKNLSYSTIGIRMRDIRAIMNIAKKDGMIKESQYPFGKGKFEIKKGSSSKRALVIDQIAKIANFTCTNDDIMFCRDIWMFLYLCNGINLRDVAKLRYKNIIDNEIEFIRIKTLRTSREVKKIRVAVIPEIQEIIDRWGNEPNPENFIFNTIGEEKDAETYINKLAAFTKKINTNMKFIGSVVGVGKITTYVARHSYATIMMRNGANIAYISDSLGHSDIKTTQDYLGSFESETRIENASLLTQYKNVKPKKKDK